MSQPDGPEFLTVDEFAALYRMARSSVYEAIAGGRLDHHRVGRNIRIHRDAGFVAAIPKPRRRKPALVIVRRRAVTVVANRRSPSNKEARVSG